MNLEALFEQCEKVSEEYTEALHSAVNAKATGADALEAVGMAEGNAIHTMATVNGGAIPGTNETARKQSIHRCVSTDPACNAARQAAKAAELAYLLLEARTKALYQHLQVLLAGLHNLSA